MELVTSPGAASDTMDLATDLETRYPHTRQALAAGLIDEYRARLDLAAHPAPDRRRRRPCR